MLARDDPPAVPASPEGSTIITVTPRAPLPPMVVSKLPQLGSTVFSLMSTLAAKTGAVNLGEGFPDFDGDPQLLDAVNEAMRRGFNQYPPMPGIFPLRQAVAEKIRALYGHAYDVDTEITVTAGATQGILTAILCAVQAGDEVIVIEPAYDSYVPAILLAGGKPVLVSMSLAPTGYTVHWDAVAAAVTEKTRMIIINSPHNPTGTVLNADDIEQLAQIVRGTRILLLSDEVYEHMVYDEQPHESLCRHPELAARAFVVSSLGKTHHVTGWKVGYVAAPALLSAEFRRVHQFTGFTVNSPMQHGLAAYMIDSATYLDVAPFYAHKRDLFRAGLADTRLRLLPVQGTYFQCVDYRAVSDKPEAEFCEWLTTEIGVAAIPMSAFYDQPRESGMIRFCFAKKDQTLKTALERLSRL